VQRLVGCFLLNGQSGIADLTTLRISIPSTDAAELATLHGRMTETTSVKHTVPVRLAAAKSFTVQWHLGYVGTAGWIVWCWGNGAGGGTTGMWIACQVDGSYGGFYLDNVAGDLMYTFPGSAVNGDCWGYYDGKIPVVSTLVIEDVGTTAPNATWYRNGRLIFGPEQPVVANAWNGYQGDPEEAMTFGYNNLAIGSVMVWDRALQVDEIANLGANPYDMVNWPIGYRGAEELPGAPYHLRRREREATAGAGIC
jgi:hypothetical protein